jgi:hypothetical protein
MGSSRLRATNPHADPRVVAYRAKPNTLLASGVHIIVTRLRTNSICDPEGEQSRWFAAVTAENVLSLGSVQSDYSLSLKENL